MDLPESVKVAGTSLRFVLKPNKQMPADNGVCKFDLGEVWINRVHVRKDAPANVVNTIVHEVNHAIHFAYGVKDGDTEEHVTELSTNGLLQVLIDNPGFSAWLHRAASLLRD